MVWLFCASVFEIEINDQCSTQFSVNFQALAEDRAFLTKLP